MRSITRGRLARAGAGLFSILTLVVASSAAAKTAAEINAGVKAAREQLTEVDKRLAGAQDLVWALVNSPAFLFNR